MIILITVGRERWADSDNYPDCSCGCKYFIPLDHDFGCDWGVCTNPSTPRAGLLTFEHQTGRGCFEYDCTVDIDSYDATIQEMTEEWKWGNN